MNALSRCRSVTVMARSGRPRSFDEADVVEHAKDVFWHRGYRASSMRELTDATGVLPGSVYAAIGDKHALFLRALALYAEDTRRAAADLARGPDVVSRLRGLLTSVLSAAVGSPGRGCMLGNTAAELLPGDDGAATIVRDALRDLEASIAEAIESAQRQGEIASDVNSTSQAVLLVALMQGLHVVARTEADPQRLHDAIDTAMQPLQRS